MISRSGTCSISVSSSGNVPQHGTRTGPLGKGSAVIIHGAKRGT